MKWFENTKKFKYRSKKLILGLVVSVVFITAGLILTAGYFLDFVDFGFKDSSGKGTNELQVKKSDSPQNNSPIADKDRTIMDSQTDKPGYNAEADKILQKYDKLLKVNKEVVGWIRIDDTKINYPLLHHSDNDYYLHRGIDNKKSTSGSIFIDYDNNVRMTDRNTLIYGHNMKDGSMFANLTMYKKESFFKKHRFIYVDSLYKENVWEVFSVYVLNADKETIRYSFDDDKDFLHTVNSYKNRSKFKTDVEINKDDRIITLVTCSYEFDNARTIVHAKLVNK